jgi:hypothetical protein
MNCVARSRSTEGEWCVVSERNPCAICGSIEAPCSGNIELSFVVCARQPSDWLLTNGSWLHPDPADAQGDDDSATDDSEELALADRHPASAASGA